MSTERLQRLEAFFPIKLFSKEALDFLRKKGLLYYSLDGESFIVQKRAGRPFFKEIKADTFLNVPSMRSHVAFNRSPDKFFLPRSNKLTLL